MTSSITTPNFKFKHALKVDPSPQANRVKTEYIKIKLPEGTEIVTTHDPHNNKYSTMIICDHEKPVWKEFIGDPGKSGVIDEDDVKVNAKDNTFTTKKKTYIYDRPGGKKIGELESKIKHPYESYYRNDNDNDEDDEKNYLNVNFDVKPSFFGKCNQKIADMLFENREKIKSLSKLSRREILALLKDPIYFPKNKEGERVPIDENNKAIFWLKCSWYPHNEKFYSEFIVPTSGDPKVLTRHELTGKVDPNKLNDPKYKVYGPTMIGTPTISFNEAYVKDDKTIYLQWRIQGAVVSKIIPRSSSKYMQEQQEEIEKVSTEDINELEKQLKMLGEDNNQEDNNQEDNMASGEMQNVDITDILQNGPSESSNDDIPGIPSLE